MRRRLSPRPAGAGARWHAEHRWYSGPGTRPRSGYQLGPATQRGGRSRAVRTRTARPGRPAQAGTCACGSFPHDLDRDANGSCVGLLAGAEIAGSVLMIPSFWTVVPVAMVHLWGAAARTTAPASNPRNVARGRRPALRRVLARVRPHGRRAARAAQTRARRSRATCSACCATRAGCGHFGDSLGFALRRGRARRRTGCRRPAPARVDAAL